MKRDLEPVDVMVAIGLCATVLGGYLFFISTSGVLEAATPQPLSIGQSVDIMTAMDWVQPAIGQAIVDDRLLSREAAGKTRAAATALNHASMADHRFRNAPFALFKQISAHATAVEADHAARIQFVLGRAIVNATARGVRTGLLSPGEVAGEYNRRMIQVAEATGQRMDEQFRNHWQMENLAQTFMTASEDRSSYGERVQQRLGHAIVLVTQAQEQYQESHTAIQGQLAAAFLASVRTMARADLFARLAAAEPTAQQAALPLTEPRAWPEIPGGFLFAVSAALIGVFFIGLLMPARRPEAPAMSEMRPEMPEAAYRKTA